MSDNKEWLEKRFTGIGGSDAGVVMGINPFKSRLQLWHEKVYQNIDDSSENLRLKLGKVLEPVIAEEYAKITGRKLDTRPIKMHPKYNFIIGNIDREIIENERGPGILEIKTKNQFTDWEEDIPTYYYAQLQHYLNIYDYSWGSFSILNLGTMKIKVVDIERDEEFIAELIKEETKFWNLVKEKIPPDVDKSPSCQEFLKEKYKTSDDITIDLTNNKDAVKWSLALKRAKDDIKVAEVIEIEAKNNLMSIMCNAEKAIGGFYSISWKAPKDKDVFNLEKFKIDCPDIYKKYTKKEPQTRRFMIRWLKQKD